MYDATMFSNRWPMIICLDLSARTKSQLDSLLEVGQYTDYSEAVAVAIANQLVLHGQIKNTRQNVITPSSDRETTPAQPEITTKTNGSNQPAAVGVPSIFPALSPARIASSQPCRSS